MSEPTVTAAPSTFADTAAEGPLLRSDCGERLMARIDALAEISESSGALTRRFATPEHRRVNAQVADWMREAGMTVHEDAIGNVIGRYEGEREGAPAILLGSHLDTVVDAGRYDGMLGVLSGLVVVEHLHASGTRLPLAVEVVGFADEEGVRYQSTFLGSRALANTLDAATLDLVDRDGIAMRDALREFGGDPERLADAVRAPETLAAYLEVHIEQGPVLERAGLGVGAVGAIAGASRLAASVRGEAGHAGTVPMQMRRDALAAAAECVVAIESLCAADSELVGTVGELHAAPGASNVIAGDARFTIDVRSPRDARRREAVAEIERLVADVARRRGVEIAIEPVQAADGVVCDEDVTRHVGDAIRASGLEPLTLTSGAGHDAMVMASITRAGMIFVRCKDGISHNPAESVTTEDAALGAEVLLRATLGIAAADASRDRIGDTHPHPTTDERHP